MKWLLIVLFVLSQVSSKAQAKVECEVLDKAISTDIFKTRFYICEQEDNIRVVDTSNFVGDCAFSEICNKKISLGNEAGGSKSKNLIELYKISKSKNVYTLYFHRPFTGAVLIMKMKYKKKRVILMKYEVGAF